MSDSQQQDELEEKVESVNEAQAAPELPGRRLRETRESKHLSRDEVAHHLRLDVQLIIALEEDQYSRLPSPAYICGYLRSYARLLKLPEDEIVQAYSHGEQINSALIPSSVQITPQKPVNTALIKIIVVLVILVLIGGGAYYLIDKYQIFSGSKSPGSDDKIQHSRELVIPAAPKTVTESLNTNKTDDSAKPEPSTAKEDKAVSKPTPPAIPPAELKTGISTVEKLPTPKATIPASEPVGSSAQAEKKPASVQTNPAQTQATATTASTQADSSGAAMAVLQLHFTDNSWVEVTDSTNKRLVYQLVDKDTDLKLQGVPPFTILLGNAPGVQVFYKGKEFDHTKYHRNQVAYFRVGGK